MLMVDTGRNRTELEETESRVEKWANERRRLSLTAQKTKVKIPRERNTLRKIEIRLEAMKVTSRKNIRYLGIKIKRNLAFKEHLDDSARKAGVYLRR